MFVEVGGRRLRVREAGEPTHPPLLLVHGAGASSLVWLSTMRRLASDFHVLALDMPGHGRSEGPAPTTLLECVEVIEGVAAALGLERFALLGHSLGGAVAMAFAATFPERLTALVLVTTGARLPVDSRFLDLLETNPRQALERLASRGAASAQEQEIVRQSVEMLMATPILSTRADFAICQTLDLRDRLQQIRCPTLVLGGTHDRLVPTEASQELQHRIHASKLRWLTESGHMPFLEQAEEFQRELLRFLETPRDLT